MYKPSFPSVGRLFGPSLCSYLKYFVVCNIFLKGIKAQVVKLALSSYFFFFWRMNLVRDIYQRSDNYYRTLTGRVSELEREPEPAFLAGAGAEKLQVMLFFCASVHRFTRSQSWSQSRFIFEGSEPEPEPMKIRLLRNSANWNKQ